MVMLSMCQSPFSLTSCKVCICALAGLREPLGAFADVDAVAQLAPALLDTLSHLFAAIDIIHLLASPNPRRSTTFVPLVASIARCAGATQRDWYHGAVPTPEILTAELLICPRAHHAIAPPRRILR